jgi:hypothetical protein
MSRTVRPSLGAHQPPGDEQEPIEWSREEDVLRSREHETLPDDHWLDERFPLALLLLAGAIFGFVIVMVAF